MSLMISRADEEDRKNRHPRHDGWGHEFENMASEASDDVRAEGIHWSKRG